jgi:antitoxin component of RelBE/YafQ-DinJ toxin-antitoxin module
MKNQTNTIIVRINDELKNSFKLRCDKEYLKMSSRIKYLIQKDCENKLKITE